MCVALHASRHLNMPHQVTDDEVRQLFQGIGTVTNVERTPDPFNPNGPSVVRACIDNALTTTTCSQVLVQFETPKMARQAAHNYQGLKALGAASLDVKHLKSDNYMRF